MVAVTVLMTVYRPERRFVESALRSVLRQSFEDFECVIVDAGPDTFMPDLVQQCCDSRVRYCHIGPRGSVPLQKNVGLEMARGSLVAMMDADDVCECNRLERLVEAFEADKTLDVVGSSVTVISASDLVIGARVYPVTDADIRFAMRMSVPFCHPATMIRRDALVRVGGYHDPHLPIEDYDLWSRLAMAGAVFCNLRDSLLRYRLHAKQIKAMYIHDCIRGVVQIKRRYWADKMTVPERIRLVAEESALVWPAAVLKWCTKRLLYSARL